MKLKIIIPVLALSVCLTACGGKTLKTNTNGISMSQSKADTFLAADSMLFSELESSKIVSTSVSNIKNISSEEAQETAQSGRKFIRTVNIVFSIPSSDGLQKCIDNIVTEAELFNGYVSENNTVFGNYARGNVTAKIPEDKADDFIENLKDSGMELSSIQDSSSDVTLEYTDVESRLNVKKQLKEKYEEYLEEARTTDELLNIEKELSDVISDIEASESKLRVLDSQIDYTSIYITVNCDTSADRESFTEKFKDSLEELCYDAGDTVIEGLEFFVNAVIMLIFVIPIAFVIIRAFMFIIKFKIPRLNKKREKNADNKD